MRALSSENLKEYLMSVSSIPPTSAPITPAVSAPKPAAPAAVAPVAKDADGDNDGSTGTKVNVKA
jgi:hypothetical protein